MSGIGLFPYLNIRHVHLSVILSLQAVYVFFDIDIFVNCNWVDTRWQYTFTLKQCVEHHN
jgi:hypothetical protein